MLFYNLLGLFRINCSEFFLQWREKAFFWIPLRDLQNGNFDCSEIWAKKLRYTACLLITSIIDYTLFYKVGRFPKLITEYQCRRAVKLENNFSEVSKNQSDLGTWHYFFFFSRQRTKRQCIRASVDKKGMGTE